MKRAALVLATSVALLLSGVSVSAHAATRKYVPMPSDGKVVGSGRGSSVSGDILTVPGDPIDGEYIPSSYGGGSKGTKLPIQPKYQYVKSRTIKGMVGKLKGGNIAAAGLTIGLQYMLDAVDGFIEDNQVMVPSVGPVLGITWRVRDLSGYRSDYISARAACDAVIANQVLEGHEFMFRELLPLADSGPSKQYNCRYYSTFTATGERNTRQAVVISNGEQCPAGSTYDAGSGGCVGENSARPATDADYDLMEAAAAAKDSEWLKERLREHCEGSLNPQGCYEELRDSTWLEGPASVSEPGPTSTTTSPAGTTTTTGNTRYDITYGDNYYDYRTTKTTIVNKPDGTTETTTETEPETDDPKEQEPEDMPAVTDLYKPYIDKLNDIKTDVSAPPAVVSPIGWSAWYSFGGGCSEITAQLPVIGSWSTNYCPYIYDWVRPILAFIFVVFTWHYCRELWSEAVTQARPM